jgi:hypothetical protein
MRPLPDPFSEAALIPHDAAVRRNERRNILREHFPVHEKPVAENDRRSVSAAVFVPDRLAVDASFGHVA